MEADELKAIWKTHDSRLEKSLALNKRCITELQTQKSVSALAPLKRNRMLEIAFVLVIIFFLGLFIHENSSTWYLWMHPPDQDDSRIALQRFGDKHPEETCQSRSIAAELHSFCISMYSLLSGVHHYDL